MGWISAVGVTQQAHRRALELCNSVPRSPSTSNGKVSEKPAAVFARSLEIRKDRSFPLNGADHATSAWAVYIDNLMEEELWCEDQAESVIGSASAAMECASRRYGQWALPGVASKDKFREVDRTCLVIRT